MSPSFCTCPSGVTYRCTLCESIVYEPMPTESGVSRRSRQSCSVITYAPTIRRASRT